MSSQGPPAPQPNFLPRLFYKPNVLMRHRCVVETGKHDPRPVCRPDPGEPKHPKRSSQAERGPAEQKGQGSPWHTDSPDEQ